jgi:hypothetical protein
MADDLGQLVRSVKTAMLRLLGKRIDGDPLTQVGEIGIVVDGAGKPLCIIETTQIEIHPFNGWRDTTKVREIAPCLLAHAHWQFSAARSHGREPNTTMPVVCQRFRLFQRLSASLGALEQAQSPNLRWQ